MVEIRSKAAEMAIYGYIHKPFFISIILEVGVANDKYDREAL